MIRRSARHRHPSVTSRLCAATFGLALGIGMLTSPLALAADTREFTVFMHGNTPVNTIAVNLSMNNSPVASYFTPQSVYLPNSYTGTSLTVPASSPVITQRVIMTNMSFMHEGEDYEDPLRNVIADISITVDMRTGAVSASGSGRELGGTVRLTGITNPASGSAGRSFTLNGSDDISTDGRIDACVSFGSMSGQACIKVYRIEQKEFPPKTTGTTGSTPGPNAVDINRLISPDDLVKSGAVNINTLVNNGMIKPDDILRSGANLGNVSASSLLQSGAVSAQQLISSGLATPSQLFDVNGLVKSGAVNLQSLAANNALPDLGSVNLGSVLGAGGVSLPDLAGSGLVDLKNIVNVNGLSTTGMLNVDSMVTSGAANLGLGNLGNVLSSGVNLQGLVSNNLVNLGSVSASSLSGLVDSATLSASGLIGSGGMVNLNSLSLSGLVPSNALAGSGLLNLTSGVNMNGIISNGLGSVNGLIGGGALNLNNVLDAGSLVNSGALNLGNIANVGNLGSVLNLGSSLNANGLISSGLGNISNLVGSGGLNLSGMNLDNLVSSGALNLGSLGDLSSLTGSLNPNSLINVNSLLSNNLVSFDSLVSGNILNLNNVVSLDSLANLGVFDISNLTDINGLLNMGALDIGGLMDLKLVNMDLLSGLGMDIAGLTDFGDLMSMAGITDISQFVDLGSLTNLAGIDVGGALSGALGAGGMSQQLELLIAQNFGRAFKNIASQSSSVMMQQLHMIGAMLDAKHQLEVQRLFGVLRADAQRDYQASEQVCAMGTLAQSNAPTRFKVMANTNAIDTILQKRDVASGGGSSSLGPVSDLTARIGRFKAVYCDPRDNGAQLSSIGCSGANPARMNRDINYTALVDRAITLDMDFTDDQLTADEEDVLALARNLYNHDVSLPIPPAYLGPDGSGKLLQDSRMISAVRSVARHSFSVIAAMKASGSGTSANQLSQVMQNLGVASGDVAGMIGQNPSYYAQMDILTQKTFQDPGFYVNLYDTPANVDRIGVAMKAIRLMHNQDQLDAALRREMVISLWLEMKIREQQGKTTNRSNRSGQ